MQISLYLFISYGFIALVMFIASMLKKQEYVSEETSRKIIHIGVSNWYFIALYFASSIDIGLLIIPPITFIFFNYLSYRLNLVKGMERADKKDLGTVYYPIALLALLLFSNAIGKIDVGFLGFMVLGYGDGLAAVVGKKFGRTRSKSGKSFIGSLTMFIVSLVVSIVTILYFQQPNYVILALFIAVFATFVEYFTPKGLDNLTVPIFTSLLYYVLLLL